VRRGATSYLWSRGGELLTDRFPELEASFSALPDGTVIDGEILAFRDDQPLRFGVLQQRIGRQKLSAQVLAQAPVIFMAYDLLEHQHSDQRLQPLRARRERLLGVLARTPSSKIHVSPVLETTTWAELALQRQESRARGVEGLMLKRADSLYGTGRKRGDWWKWKVDPYTLDAVLIYAQAGHGRRATLFTDYTFAVRDNTTLVPLAKAYSGLSDDEITQLDRWIRGHTQTKFGPVRAVEPVQVFELAFEGIQASPRHKSGVALRFPRIMRWRQDKPAAEADTLQTVRNWLT